ncbi:hypothetical protein Acr_00g0080000 [Actinidia rufa]|uniref:Uncharacterized protein n=1 Tax=Actinidia rufa TaxID=165716 RepID=A0A7J0DTY2_9ERIC|nr:hypothetical protein Acr_00g0080000 [Actinidia rufa]
MYTGVYAAALCKNIQRRTKEARHRANPDGEALLRRRSRPVGGHCEATTRAVECQGSTTWPVGGKASDDKVCPTPIEASARSYEVCRRFDKRRRGLSEMRRGLSEVQRACFYRYASVFVGNAFLMRSGCVSVALLRKKRRFAVWRSKEFPLTWWAGFGIQGQNFISGHSGAGLRLAQPAPVQMLTATFLSSYMAQQSPRQLQIDIRSLSSASNISFSLHASSSTKFKATYF